jgi:hypothetical protein
MIWSDDAGNYTCGDCGNTWKARAHYKLWPIRLHWDGPPWFRFQRWGIEVGNRGIERPVLATVVRIGPLRVVVGCPEAPRG